MTPLAHFRALVSRSSLEELDAMRARLLHESVGGGVKGKVETEVVHDFLRVIHDEQKRRRIARAGTETRA